MTEHEWLTCDDPQRMMTKVARRGVRRRDSEPGGSQDWASARKLRLIACAFVRQVWHLLAARSRGMVEAAERMADGKITQGAVYDASELASQVCGEQYSAGMSNSDPLRLASLAAYWCAPHTHRNAVDSCVMATTRYVADINEGPGAPSRADRMRAMANASRCIIGNPYRPVTVPDFYTGDRYTIHRLSLAAYEERTGNGHLDPARLAVLADALEEAGCSNEPILAHLRSPGPHWRGCWAVDLLTGKE